MSENNENRQKLGALWERTSQSGDTYFSGELEIPEGMSGKVRVVAFKNRNKTEKQPDYSILKSKEPTTAKPPPVVKKVVKKVVPKPPPQPEEEEVEVEEETDI